jgi:hypothetical protein
VFVLPSAGCGGKNDAPELGKVKGQVTLDGSPLPDATVSYDPKEGGRTSTAVTDKEGHYELNYTLKAKGAKLGAHRVRISTYVQGGDEPNAEVKTVPEKVPAKYQKPDSLKADVKAGENTVDFKLESK